MKGELRSEARDGGRLTVKLKGNSRSKHGKSGAKDMKR